MEKSHQITGSFKIMDVPGFPKEMLKKKFFINVEGTKVTCTATDGHGFMIFDDVTTIISAPSEVLVSNPQGTFNFTEVKDTTAKTS